MIRRVVHRLTRPHYVFRPSAFVRWAWWRLNARRLGETLLVPLPWGVRIRCRSFEYNGMALWHYGIHELEVSEALWRLADRGECAVDVGAHIGHMTSLLAARVGPGGRVLAFEANPDVFADLQGNLGSWAGARHLAPMTAAQTALSDTAGSATMVLTAAYDGNRGLGRVERSAAAPPGGKTITVAAATLDEVLADTPAVGVMKLDVEGHEAAVLTGGERTLRAGRIRDVVYEDHHGYPGEASRLLESAGYTVFGLSRGFFGPRLIAPSTVAGGRAFEAPNFLATREPARLRARLTPLGWRVL